MKSACCLLLASSLIPFCDGPVPNRGAELVYQVKTDQPPDPEKIERARKVIERRLQALGIPGAGARLDDAQQVVVRIPGGKNLHRVKRACQQRGELIFAPVDDAGTRFLKERFGAAGTDEKPRSQTAAEAAAAPAAEMPAGVVLQHEHVGEAGDAYYLRAGDRQALQRAVAGLAAAVPEGRRLLLGLQRGARGESWWRTYLVAADAWPAGEHVTEGEVQQDPHLGLPQVAIGFDAAGAERFAALTAELVKRRLAIAVDGRVHSAPVVQMRITGGRAVISLGNSGRRERLLAQAEALAAVLQAGKLPVPLELAVERSYGPLREKKTEPGE
jgi:preprotein translocase subunit SecD